MHTKTLVKVGTGRQERLLTFRDNALFYSHWPLCRKTVWCLSAYEFFSEGLVGVDGVCHGICDAIVDAVETRGVGIANPSHLEGCSPGLEGTAGLLTGLSGPRGLTELTGHSGLSYRAHLDWRRAAREDVETIICGVSGEFHQNIDLVVAYYSCSLSCRCPEKIHPLVNILAQSS